MIRSLTAVALSFSLAATPALAQTVVIVRHGEKVSPNGDPDLSPTGQARARALAASLAGAKVSMVLATPLKRTQQTGQPTADAAGVKVVPIALDGGTAAHAQRVAEAARKAPIDATVLIVGHSNTFTDIARALGDPAPETLTDCEYDHMTIIQLGGAAPKVVHARYGAATQAC
ncbi:MULTISPECIES: histidine phosphatase family protein [unclassified Caulobacter]|uniref:SixA phosphatase family protein n=1 Tax=unclassified Caulobacter TaxID=2648921 RepID=UPI0006FE20ED|nr:MULTISPECIES: histidine phosphatase family protein [unclassified Caulobacter]KQV62665.1 phosphoglycerate mutase [Caulobacter sp. Root342]KQV71798.1 phosphoglycerate mutase [Caulobacter sp. Root343]